MHIKLIHSVFGVRVLFFFCAKIMFHLRLKFSKNTNSNSFSIWEKSKCKRCLNGASSMGKSSARFAKRRVFSDIFCAFSKGIAIVFVFEPGHVQNERNRFVSSSKFNHIQMVGVGAHNAKLRNNYQMCRVDK